MKKVVLLNPWCPAVRNPRTLRMEMVRKALEHDFEVSILCCTSKAVRTLDEGEPVRSSLFNWPLVRLWKVFQYCVNTVAFPDAYFFHSLRLLVKLWNVAKHENVCVISFSPPFSTHLAACVFRKYHPASFWIADVGDLYHKNPTSVLLPVFRPMQRIFQKYLLCRADWLIFNSKGIQERMIQENRLDKKKCKLIYNGSSVDFSSLDSIKETSIRFLYAGSTYARLREGLWEMEILSEILIILQDRGYEAKIRLAGRQCEKLIDQWAQEKKVQMIHHSDRDKLISLYRHADFLICFSNGDYPGLPSKLCEYRASGLPIICFAEGPLEAALDYLSDYEPWFPFISGKTKLEDLLEFILVHRSKRIKANHEEDQRIGQQWRELLFNSSKNGNTFLKV